MEQRLDVLWRRVGHDLWGIVGAAVFFTLAFTPSLIPRPWAYQGLVSGIAAAIGYLIGVAAKGLVVRFVVPRVRRLGRDHPLPARWRPAEAAVVRIRYTVVLLFVGWQVGVAAFGVRWQQQLAEVMGDTPIRTADYLRIPLVAVPVFLVLVFAGRGLWAMSGSLSAFLVRRLRMSRQAARTVGIVVVAALVIGVVDGVLTRVFFDTANRLYSLENDRVPDGAEPPTESERSGSPESLASWESLGYEGRYFVSRGLRRDSLAAMTRADAMQPIRVYAGLESAGSDEARADLVIAELERTGAFGRSVVVVIPTTGTGWVNPTAAQAIELVHGGDSALVAMQYSYLPSAISFLADREKAAAAGATLVNRVHERIQEIPVRERPRLFVFGESLGTQSGEGAFSGLRDIRATVDGVLWVGPPHSNPLWRQFVERRDPGTREMAPVYSGGLAVRFSEGTAPILPVGDEWVRPRVLYLFNPSDPVVWWSPGLLFRKPDWLEEPPVGDRIPAMRWLPVVTFWQVSADLANAAAVPSGHGHNYGTKVLDGWVAVAGDDSWDAGRLERYRRMLELAMSGQGPEK